MIQKDQTFQREVSGIRIEAKISPCSWMYKHIGLQLSLSAPGVGNAHARGKIAFDQATAEDAQKILDSVRIIPCKTCGKPAFDPKTVAGGPDGDCGVCRIAKIDAEIAVEAAKEQAKLKRMDAKYKKQGYTHRIEGWIHPATGDDRQISFWMKNPTEAQIKSELRKARSTVLDDYAVIEL